MRQLSKATVVVAIISITVFTLISCGGKTFNSAEELKEYLDKQPANSTDKPLKVRININDLMFKDIESVVNSAGKYVILDFSRSTGLTAIEERAFRNSKALTGMILPNTISKVGGSAFRGCANLKDITITGVDSSLNGKWVSDNNSFFFNNGVLRESEDSSFDDIVLYTTKDGSLNLISEGEKITYSIKGNTLSLKDDDGDEILTLTRQK